MECARHDTELGCSTDPKCEYLASELRCVPLGEAVTKDRIDSMSLDTVMWTFTNVLPKLIGISLSPDDAALLEGRDEWDDEARLHALHATIDKKLRTDVEARSASAGLPLDRSVASSVREDVEKFLRESDTVRKLKQRQKKKSWASKLFSILGRIVLGIVRFFWPALAALGVTTGLTLPFVSDAIMEFFRMLGTSRETSQFILGIGFQYGFFHVAKVLLSRMFKFVFRMSDEDFAKYNGFPFAYVPQGIDPLSLLSYAMSWTLHLGIMVGMYLLVHMYLPGLVSRMDETEATEVFFSLPKFLASSRHVIMSIFGFILRQIWAGIQFLGRKLANLIVSEITKRISFPWLS